MLAKTPAPSDYRKTLLDAFATNERITLSPKKPDSPCGNGRNGSRKSPRRRLRSLLQGDGSVGANA